MVTSLARAAKSWTAADLARHFGPIPIERIRTTPPPGHATEQDVINIHDRENRLCELVDGVLVEKTVGHQESYLAAAIVGILYQFVNQHGLGHVLGADGMARLAPRLVRIPDASFISWESLGSKRIQKEPMLNIAPTLAVEVLSPSNTSQEMNRKLHDYFEAGVQLVWYIDAEGRTATVYTSVDQCDVLDESHTLDGGKVLPGFRLALSALFAPLEKPAAPAKPPRKNGGRRKRKKKVTRGGRGALRRNKGDAARF